MRLTYSKDKNGGSRDVLIDGQVVAEALLSSDAVRLVERVNEELDLVRARAEAAEARVAGLYFAMEQIVAISADRARFVAQGPRGFAEAERIAKAAIAAAKGGGDE